MRIDTLSTLTVGFLAGGTGQRLGGRDKGLLPRGGDLQIHLLRQSVPGWVSEIIINNSRNAYVYQHFCDRLVSDLSADAGPVAGVLALLYACCTDWLAVIPCDQKQLPEAWIGRWQATMRTGREGCTATDNGRFTPLAILPKTALPMGQAYFDSGGRKLSEAYAAMELSKQEYLGAGLDIDDWHDLEEDSAEG